MSDLRNVNQQEVRVTIRIPKYLDKLIKEYSLVEEGLSTKRGEKAAFVRRLIKEGILKRAEDFNNCRDSAS